MLDHLNHPAHLFKPRISEKKNYQVHKIKGFYKRLFDLFLKRL